MLPPSNPPEKEKDLSTEDYRRLADLRAALRAFLHWSAEQARAAGLTPTQHQLLLAIRASPETRGPTVGDLAGALLIQHHSAVELVDRAQAAGLITRQRETDLHSVVRVQLTARGAQLLRSLSQAHRREIAQLAPSMQALWAVPEAPGGAAS